MKSTSLLLLYIIGIISQRRNVTFFDDHDKRFESKDQSNNSLCFNFKEHRIIPTDYTIRSYPCIPNYSRRKSCVVEYSNNNDSWETVDEQKDCPFLNGDFDYYCFIDQNIIDLIF